LKIFANILKYYLLIGEKLKPHIIIRAKPEGRKIKELLKHDLVKKGEITVSA